jgi:FtsZ-interacting cell division protein ZipA
VTELVNNWKTAIEKGDIYAALTTNIPASIGNKFNGFNNEPDAKATIDAWHAFEQTPSKESFEKFTTEFIKFGNGGLSPEEVQQQQAQQANQQAPQQQQQPNNNQQAQQPVQNNQLVQQQPAQAQPAPAPAQTTQQPAQQQPQQNVNASYEVLNKHRLSEKKDMNFSERLALHISGAKKMSDATKVLENYWHPTTERLFY